MAAAAADQMGLIVRHPPWRHRAARADLDLALAAAAMDFQLAIYFLGPALLQLAAKRDIRTALLPSGYRAWASLPELTDARVYAEQSWLDACADRSISLILDPAPLSPEAMRASWRRCRHVLMV
jgi:sulfur relay (sulfurtransferase) DsrF/TusC family protein